MNRLARLAAALAVVGLVLWAILAGDGGPFAFLHQPAGFDVSDTLIAFSGTDTAGRAVAAGILNVVTVGAMASLLACIAAALLTAMRLSAVPPLVVAARAITDTVRSTPLLLQIVALYFLLLALPPPREAQAIFGCILPTNRGLFLPIPTFAGIDCPALAGFQVRGGFRLSVEITALVAGLSLYAAAFLAEILRGALAAVPSGQWDAARSLGLKPLMTFLRIILPQALIAALPPASSVFSGVFKNTSLGIAIGYSDLMTISNSIITVTHRSVEMMVLVCLAFFAINYAVIAALAALHGRLSRRFARDAHA